MFKKLFRTILCSLGRHKFVHWLYYSDISLSQPVKHYHICIHCNARKQFTQKQLLNPKL
jgi:hypothetical protein